MFVFEDYTMEQHDDHYMNDDAREDCEACFEAARIDKIERIEEALYGDYQERYW